uniref:Uncharacterized protein LOC111117853 n=1 Tax=Crassostrea virginica TaxID=6565 RepID=A0A8B8CAK6_CRAVI|nr:uncharacterized protein LOC111117853 [Crassostrea virginica]
MRSSLWRYYPWSQMGVPKNVDDTGLNCGGYWRLHEINKGKCGLCGDPYDQTRQNEAGGKFANGYIVQKYYHDDEYMNVTVDVLSNIGGYFEFYLCPMTTCRRPSLRTAWISTPDHQGLRKQVHTGYRRQTQTVAQIPDGVTCSQCVLQWKWVGGNNWGICPDGYGGLGCGKQEEYYNCADIAILPTSGNRTSGNRTRNTEPDIQDPTSTPVTTHRTR